MIIPPVPPGGADPSAPIWRRRFRWIVYFTQPEGVELLSCLVTAGWGLWLVLRVGFRPPADPTALNQLGVQAFWGALMFFIGGMHTLALLRRWNRWRRWMSFLSGAIWIGILIRLAFYDWMLVSIPLYLFAAAAAGWSYLRLSGPGPGRKD
jgi:hypothetical protein